MDETAKIQAVLAELEKDESAAANRIAVCEGVGQALARVGQWLWVHGYMIGSDRVEGASPYKFGDDRNVGVATVAQIAGELIGGAASLLKTGNRYSAAALVRQLVEAEYLAHAFAEQHTVAADWLRADRKRLRNYWSPSKLRERAGGRFLPSDYQHHCNRGGHPSIEGMNLLPDHQGMSAAYLWADMAGHSVSIWRHICRSADSVQVESVQIASQREEIEELINFWRETDSLFVALQDIGAVLRSAGANTSGSGG